MSSTESMAKILVATHNRDKFEIVKETLRLLGLSEYEFLSLSDLDILEKPVEIGINVENRAIQKVIFYEDIVIQRSQRAIDIIIAEDDGINIPNRIIETPELKMLTSSILRGDLIEIGEEVDLLQGFAVKIVLQNLLLSCTTSIPFMYVKSNIDHRTGENSYPLKKVLARLFTKSPIADVPAREVAQYYAQYSQSELGKIIEKIRSATPSHPQPVSVA